MVGLSIESIDLKKAKELAIEYSNGKVEHIKSLAYSNPCLVSEWHPSLNGKLTAADVAPNSHKKIWWICEKGHEWQAEIASRTAGSGCPICASKIIFSGFNDLLTKFPEIAAEWHPTLNGDKLPSDVTSHSGEKFWWKCSKCGHEWMAKVANRTTRESGCPKCKAYKLAKRNSSPMVGESLADKYPEIALEWHPQLNEELTAANVKVSSNKRVWWQCHICGYVWNDMIYYRTARNKGCPECNKAHKNTIPPKA